MTYKIPPCILEILETLELQGFKSYLVGGCVRDLLGQKRPKDWDICTPATPDELISIFPSCIQLGLKFGTIALQTPEGMTEITTFREELDYINRRHPKVSFVRSLESDLKRRDFTINAIAYNPKEGLIDLFNGQKDLQEKTLRCVGDPSLRFSEDALRILRLARFSCVLGFHPDSSALQQAKAQKDSLFYLSKERIRDELILALRGDFFIDFFDMYFEIFQIVLPELKKAKKHTIKNIPLLFAFLFEKEEDYKALERLKFSKLEIQRTQELLKYKNLAIEESPICIKFLLRDIGYDSFMAILELQKLSGKNTKKLYALTQEIMIKDECFSLRDLQIKGNDLLRIGLKGKEVGEVLDKLLVQVIQGEVDNSFEALLDRAYSFSRV